MAGLHLQVQGCWLLLLISTSSWSPEKIAGGGLGSWVPVQGGCIHGTSLAQAPGRGMTPASARYRAGSFDVISVAGSLPSPALGKGSCCSLAPLPSTAGTHSHQSLFLPASCFRVRAEALTCVCWLLANLLSRLISPVSSKFRLLWTYRG